MWHYLLLTSAQKTLDLVILPHQLLGNFPILHPMKTVCITAQSFPYLFSLYFLPNERIN